MRAAPLDYAPAPLDKPRWGPVLFRPARRTLVLILLTALTLFWLDRRHEPWRHLTFDRHEGAADGLLFTPSNKLLDFYWRGVSVFDPHAGRQLHDIADPRPPNAMPMAGFSPLRGGREIVMIIGGHATLYDGDTAATLATHVLPADPEGAELRWEAGPLLRADRLLYAQEPHAPAGDISSRVFPRPPTRFRLTNLDALAPGGALQATARTLAATDGTVGLAPDGRTAIVTNRLTAGTPDEPIQQLFEFETGREIPLDPPYTFRPNGYPRFSPDGRWLFLPEVYRNRQWVPGEWIYSTRTGKRLPPVLETHRPIGNARYSQADVTPDGRHLAVLVEPVVARASTLELYDLTAPATPVATRRVRGPEFMHVLFSPDGARVFAAGSAPGQFALYDVPRLRPVALLPSGVPRLQRTTFSADGHYLAGAGPDGRLHVYEKVGLECRESILGVLGMPHAWLLILLLAFSAFALRSDARRRAPEPPGPALALLSTLLLFAALPRTAQALLAVSVNQLVLTPAPVLLLCAVGLATNSRFWRFAAVLTLALAAAVELHCALYLHRTAPIALTTIPILDRSLDLPNRLLIPALLTATIAALASLTTIARARS